MGGVPIPSTRVSGPPQPKCNFLKPAQIPAQNQPSRHQETGLVAHSVASVTKPRSSISRQAMTS